MGVTYFRRFRMEYDLSRPLFEEPRLPDGYSLVPWDDELLETHAEVKFRCFRSELDANVFPSLGARDGCRRLMSEIAQRQGFVPEATWLLQSWPADDRKPELCGTIQGVADDKLGAIQNIGITPAHRGKGLGSLLVWHSLAGFVRAGIPRVYLEVTAQNAGACRLYRRLGFQQTKVVYKASEVAYAEW
ncbi:MAG TPA: GNAT family N-acetyltransferase [Pirellulaceae bacterium]|nr:GNAT family N-acetyltransferase [Pirellulaceae bacterium]